MNKSRLMSTVCSFLLFVVFSSSAKAGLIFETATGSFNGTNSGTHVSTVQFIGSRFKIDHQTTIQGIGGHFLLNDHFNTSFGGSIFGALVNLNSSELPSATNLTLDNVIASTVFTPTWGTDYLAPINATLKPGTYGVILGSGLFGATGKQALTLIQSWQRTSSSGTMFASSTSRSWHEFFSEENRLRIILSDTAPAVVPIPATLWLFGSSLVGLIGLSRRKA